MRQVSYAALSFMSYHRLQQGLQTCQKKEARDREAAFLLLLVVAGLLLPAHCIDIVLVLTRFAWYCPRMKQLLTHAAEAD